MRGSRTPQHERFKRDTGVVVIKNEDEYMQDDEKGLRTGADGFFEILFREANVGAPTAACRRSSPFYLPPPDCML
jgi:hypothetical protein